MGIQLQQQQEERPLTDLQLRPEVKGKLEAYWSTYLELANDLELLQQQLDLEKSKIGKILADHGYDKVKTADGSNLTWVRGATTSSLDKKKLCAQGVTMAQIEAAMVVRPKRDYFQIRRRTVNTESSEEC